MNEKIEKYDCLIVGAGLYGSTMAYKLRTKGLRCIMVDKRRHLGGNVHCRDMEGINVHLYGAHIFHTSNKRVWDFVNSLVPFNRYTNAPLANYKGRLYNLPFNMNTFRQMWGVATPAEAMAIVERQREEERRRIGMESDGGVPRNLEEQALTLVGRDIYETLVKGYTEKQWGRKCRDLPSFIIRRLPIRFAYDNNYFNDTFQGIPVGGYNRLIDALTDGTDTMTGNDFFDKKAKVNAENWRNVASRMVFTGKIDEFYGYRYGRLEYRSLRFEHRVLDVPNQQGNAVINYTDADVPYTRTIEHKHFETFGDGIYDKPKTVVSTEYPQEWKDGLEPYYPINDERNTLLYQKYRRLAEAERDIEFGGRLAEYKYYDMAPIIEKILFS